ncbi:hypothetical protein [Sphingobacterium sp. LRF_L2]|uniref:hypothetical protein n=1 Tax=Sphingobacterium sp. LRF_L2 TaxID=3369421 RepID=UPI003F5DFD64
MSTLKTLLTLKASLLVYLFLGCSIAAYTQNDYQYNPIGSFRLGFGFSKEDYTKSYPISPFTFEEQTPNKSASNFLFNTELVYDEKTLRDYLHFDLKVASKALKYSANAKVNVDIEKKFSLNSLNILLEATTEFGKTVLNNVKLTSEAERLLNDPSDLGHKRFIAKYGTNFVSEVRNGVSVFTLITINNVSNEFRREYGLKASGSLKLGLAKTTMSTNLNKEIYQASKSNRIQYKVWGAGGEGIAGLADIFKNLNKDSDCLEIVRNVLTEYIKTLNFSQSSAIGFKTASYSVLGLDAKDPWTEENEDRITEIYNEYHRVKAINKKISDMLSPEDIYFQELLPKEKQKDLHDLLLLTKQRLTELAELHKSSMKDPDNRDVIPEVLDIDLDKVLPQFPEFGVAYVVPPSIPIYGLLGTIGDSDELSSPRIWDGIKNEHYATYFYMPLPADDKLKGLVIYNNFNNKSYFKFISDIKIYKNGTLILSFKDKINSGKNLKLASNDYRNSVHVVNFNKFNNFSTITSVLVDDYQKILTDFNNGSQNRIDVDYTLTIEDVFQNEFEYPILSDHRAGGNISHGLKHLSKDIASMINIDFDLPTMNDKDTLCASIAFLLPKIDAEVPEDFTVVQYEKDSSLMVVQPDKLVTKYKYNKDNKYQLIIETPYKHLVKGYIVEYYFIKSDGKISTQRKKRSYVLNGKFKEQISDVIEIDPVEFIN